MIFYKAIKYSILDCAIDVLFDRVLFNLGIGSRKISIKDLVPGMKIKQINYIGISFFDCMLDEYHRGVGSGYDDSWFIYIFYNSKSDDDAFPSSESALESGYRYYSGLCPDNDNQIEIYV